MVRGIELFRDYFHGYEENYTIIGGSACDLWMEDAGLSFRTTKDLDVVLTVEKVNDSFAQRFWQFIGEGAYQSKEKSTGEHQFYRFSNPSNPKFPYMIELFSRKPDFHLEEEDSACVPIHISDEVSSLSAILLNTDYYKLLLDERTRISGIPILTVEALILFKAKAWLDLTDKDNSGQHVDSRDINKHKNDVYRLSFLLKEDMILKQHGAVARDISTFLDKISPLEDENSPIFSRVTKNELLRIMRKVFGLIE